MGPASVMVGNLVQGNRLAVAHGRDIGFSEDNERKVRQNCSSVCYLIDVVYFPASNHNWSAAMESKYISRSCVVYIVKF